jgi:hypothetical protein
MCVCLCECIFVFSHGLCECPLCGHLFPHSCFSFIALNIPIGFRLSRIRVALLAAVHYPTTEETKKTKKNCIEGKGFAPNRYEALSCQMLRTTPARIESRFWCGFVEPQERPSADKEIPSALPFRGCTCNTLAVVLVSLIFLLSPLTHLYPGSLCVSVYALSIPLSLHQCK